MACPATASSDSASSGEAAIAARPAGSPENGACSSLTARSLALVTTGASAMRRKSSAAASGPMSKLPTETIRPCSCPGPFPGSVPAGTTTTGLDCEELSSICRMVRA
jgi:hypothetical protein